MRIPFQSNLADSGKYRPDIDGLRALAVLAVLFFHAKVLGFTGGFVGVDIFYVISGYLITSIIVKDIALGRFSIVSFYERRIRRIFPALCAVLWCCTLTATLLLSPKDLFAFGKSLIAVTFFLSNVFFEWKGGPQGYFSQDSESHALLHTWSLSVEEQFYLFFPVALLLLTRWSNGRIRLGILLAAIASLLIAVWATEHRPLVAFYVLAPRAWELLVGSLLAVKAVPALGQRLGREIAGLVGLGLILWGFFVFTDDTSFPGLNALIPCLGAGLIIYSGETGPSSVRSLLSFRLFVFIGTISYSLYLWHWPVLVFTRWFTAGLLTGAETIAVIVASMVLAVLSFVFIEKPFRGRASRVGRKQIFGFGLAAMTISGVFGLVVYLGHGLPERYDDRTRRLLTENTHRKDDFLEVCGNWKKEVYSVADVTGCQLGPASSRKIMFWGDSHVQQLYPVIKKLYDSGDLLDHGVLFSIADACPPTEHMNNSEQGYHCDSFAHLAMQRAEYSDVDTVFIGFNTWWSIRCRALCASVGGKCIGTPTQEETRRRFLQDISEQVQALTVRGKRVIVSLPFPFFDRDIPDLELRNAVLARFGLVTRARDLSLPRMREDIAAIAKSSGASIFDPRQSLCDVTGCVTEIDGISIYKDQHHLAASQVGILEDNLKQILQFRGGGRQA